MAKSKKTNSKPARQKNTEDKKKTIFDHVKHIRQIQDPNYYNNLSEDDRKSFNHFMILRALSMDVDILETAAQLYQVFDRIPSPQFYQLLIAIVPKSYDYYPWVKSKKFKNNPELLKIISDVFKIPSYQANEYVNLLLKINGGATELEDMCRAYGLGDSEINELFNVEKE